jgi:hypothetical protein
MLTPDECSQLLTRYEEAVSSRIKGHKSKNGSQLLELDKWRLTELSKTVRERQPAYMTKSELEKLMECKLYIPVSFVAETAREANSGHVCSS